MTFTSSGRQFKTRDEELDHSPIDFGKHNGKTPSEISEIDPGYVIWMYQNFNNKPCSKALYEACVQDEAEDEDDEPSFR